MDIYIYGCNCGITGVLVRKVRRYAAQNGYSVELHNSKYSRQDQQQHMELLGSIGAQTGEYTPIVVLDGKVILLKSWSLS